MAEVATHTRDALLDAAEGLFSSRGQAAVGIREIAEQAGANVASIKYHFGSKHELYLATVRRAMARGEDESGWSTLSTGETAVGTAEDAAVILARFIHTYLTRLETPGPHQACGTLMLWEALQPSEALDAVIRDYIRPSQEGLVHLVERLLPAAEHDVAALYARSILAQILHQRVFRPFIERLEEADAAPVVTAERSTTHIVRFSLRAMGHGDDFVERVLREAGIDARDPSVKPGASR